MIELVKKPIAQIVPQVEEVARLMDSIATVAPSSVPVLLLGPRSTGVELIAQAIHVCSPRRSRPFVKAACGVHAETILQSPFSTAPIPGEENGQSWNERGSNLEAANSGTLFIDQVQNATPAVQVELLRLITDQEYVDAKRGEVHQADLRLVVSAWTDLERRCEKGQFRKDLFDKLSMITLHVRKGCSSREWVFEVIGLLGEATHGRGKAANGSVPASLVGEIDRYSWSPEVRTLRQAIAETLKQSETTLDPETIFFNILRTIGNRRAEDLAQHQLQAISTAVERCVDTYEFFGGHMYDTLIGQLQRTLIQRAMIQCNGTLSRAARILGISSGLLETKLRELGLDGGASHTA